MKRPNRIITGLMCLFIGTQAHGFSVGPFCSKLWSYNVTKGAAIGLAYAYLFGNISSRNERKKLEKKLKELTPKYKKASNKYYENLSTRTSHSLFEIHVSEPNEQEKKLRRDYKTLEKEVWGLKKKLKPTYFKYIWKGCKYGVAYGISKIAYNWLSEES